LPEQERHDVAPARGAENQMTESTRAALGPGDRAPDFELPAADVEGSVALAEFRRRGPVLLTMLRGLYCPFCRRHISQLRPTCEALQDAGIALVGVVIASAERSRRYFAHFPPCFPMAAAPDREIHRAYGLTEVVRTPELRQDVERRVVEALRDLGIQAPPGEAGAVFVKADGFDFTTEDQAEYERPLQTVGHFLIGRDGVIRWARIETIMTPLPSVDDLQALI
jgi:peroxiredoxin